MGINSQEQQTGISERRPLSRESFPEQVYERGLREQPAVSRQDSYQPEGTQQPQPAQSPIHSSTSAQQFYQMGPSMPVAPPTMVHIGWHSPNMLVRALWFLFVGWWLGLIWLHLGYVLCATGLFLPVGLMMLNRLPGVLTLKADDRQALIVLSQGSRIAVYVGGPQIDFLLRVLYFLLVGWWAGYLWALTGYLFCFSIIFMPLGVLMLNQLPTVLTLRQM